VELRPIGIVRRDGETSRLEIAPAYAAALKDIDKPRALDVLYWMHELTDDQRKRLQVRPRGDPSRSLQGVFSLRSPMRPNPIGVTTVKLLRREGTTLIVSGLDAHDGSPIIDIKSAKG